MRKNITLDRQITFASFVLSTAENLLILELAAPLNDLPKQLPENSEQKIFDVTMILLPLHEVVVLTQTLGAL